MLYRDLEHFHENNISVTFILAPCDLGGQSGLAGLKSEVWVENPNQLPWSLFWTSAGFPLGPENLENLEKWKGIFQPGKSFKQTGKVRENHTKYWKT